MTHSNTDVMASVKSTPSEVLKTVDRPDLLSIFRRTTPLSKKMLAAMVTAERRQHPLDPGLNPDQ